MKNNICAFFLFTLVIEQLSVEIFGQYYQYPIGYQYYYTYPYNEYNYFNYDFLIGNSVNAINEKQLKVPNSNTKPKENPTTQSPLPTRKNYITKRIRYDTSKDKKIILSDFKPGNVLDYEYEYDTLPENKGKEKEFIIYPVKLINGRYQLSKMSLEKSNNSSKNNQETITDENSVENLEKKTTPETPVLTTTSEIKWFDFENSKEDEPEINKKNENDDYEDEDNSKTDEDDYEDNK